MSTRIKYQFKLTKQAVVQTPKGLAMIGTVEYYYDIDGEVKVTIKFIDGLPKELIEKLAKNPSSISIIGQPGEISNVELINPPLIHLK